MTEFLRDPMWQFAITVIIAVTAMCISIILYLKQRKRKALSYEVLSRTSLLGSREKYRAKVEIYFEKKPVDQVHLVSVRIVNSGNVAIKSDDYERLLGLKFPKGTQVLSVEVVKTIPPSLMSSVGTRILDTKNEVEISPCLLNEDDSITLNMLVDKLERSMYIDDRLVRLVGDVTVDGRIVGVKEIRLLESSFKKEIMVAISGMILALSAINGRSQFADGSLGQNIMTWLSFVGIGTWQAPFFLSKKVRKWFADL